MWQRLRRLLLDSVGVVLTLTLLAGWVALVASVVSASDIDLGRRGVGLLAATFIVPLGVGVAIDEFVIHRLRLGRTPPGRHVRTAKESDQAPV